MTFCLAPGPARRANVDSPAWPRRVLKIDAAVALMVAVGRAMAADDGQPDIGDFFRAPLFA